MNILETKSRVITFRELKGNLLFVCDSLEVKALNESYKKEYNYYFLDVDNIKAYASFGLFPDSAVFVMGE